METSWGRPMCPTYDQHLKRQELGCSELKQKEERKTYKNKTNLDHSHLLARGVLKYLVETDGPNCHLKFANYVQ